jgi:hypothetical protein
MGSAGRGGLLKFISRAASVPAPRAACDAVEQAQCGQRLDQVRRIAAPQRLNLVDLRDELLQRILGGRWRVG